jgi:hypothetical protein
MAPISWLRLSLLLPLIFLAAQSAANAAPSLADAIKEVDAKYLEVPDVEGADNAPKIESGGGEEEETPGPQEISQGAVKAALSYSEDKGEDGEITRTPVIMVFADGKEVAKLAGEGTGSADPPVSVQIAEIDPANQYPEVVVSFYTGGRPLLSDTSVVTSSADGSSWQTVDVGGFDGGPMLATDLNGDGHYEFQTRDNAFLYAFACYACSEAPLELLTVENGAAKNVTTDEKFKPRMQPISRAWSRTFRTRT